MSKKRRYRNTAEEQAIHKEAVRLRNMTDKQLVEEFHRAVDPEMGARLPEVAQDGVKATEAKTDTSDVEKLLNALSEGRCKGIKGATAYKVAQMAAEMGLV